MAQNQAAAGVGAAGIAAYQPSSLYDLSKDTYVKSLSYKVSCLNKVQELKCLPPEMLIDIFLRMNVREDLGDMLLEQLADLETFERLLRYDPARQRLIACVSFLMRINKPLPNQLRQSFTGRYHHQPKTKTKNLKTASKLATLVTKKLKMANLMQRLQSENENEKENIDANAIQELKTEMLANEGSDVKDDDDDDKTDAGDDDVSTDNDEVASTSPTLEDLEITPKVIDFGLRLGSFLTEAGWLSESIEILQCVAAWLRDISTNSNLLIIRLDCLQRLLQAEAALCNFKSAALTFAEISDLLQEIPTESIPNNLLASTYTQFSAMYFARSEYDHSHMWSVLAIRFLDETTPEKIAVDVLRQAAKACVVKRDFQRANMLICQATRKASKAFGPNHQKYGDTLLDYGFFLLNVDSVFQSVNVYKEALEVKRSIFGNRNFHVAIAHEDLSYAYYVHEYSTGNFNCAREHVEKAVDIMKDLVPSDHLMLASAKRVKALLLEEIALDKMADGVDEEDLLKQSEDLHKFALQLSLDVFGEVNVQTAKHYGNLGRLYQTMNRFEEAERMHQKAIKIKTDLLGPYDYEVGLSIGHLASLYNYQMKKYREAEDLYLRSIEISLRLFGRSYSGLEYDYLGLCNVYETLREFEKYVKYAVILENWQTLRSQNITMNKSIYPAINEDCSMEEIKNQFFNSFTQLTPCN